jgi:hypothetical protein
VWAGGGRVGLGMVSEPWGTRKDAPLACAIHSSPEGTTGKTTGYQLQERPGEPRRYEGFLGVRYLNIRAIVLGEYLNIRHVGT